MKRFRNRLNTAVRPSRSSRVLRNAASVGGHLCENLERRTLFSVVSVSSFGALGNGVHDDTSAIQQSINSAKAGDVIAFSAGSYEVSQTLNLKSGLIYQGAGGTTLDWKGGSSFLLATENNASNITVTGLTLNGAGMKFNGICERVNLTNSTIENVLISNSGADNGIYIAGLHDSVIQGVNFKNIPNDHGILGYHVVNTQITDNQFDTIGGDCIQLLFEDSTPAAGVVVSRNTGINLGRMGIEIQSINGMKNTTVGMLVQGNNFSQYMGLTPGTIKHNTFGLSIVSDGYGTVISDNVLTGANGSDWGIEVGGIATQVTNNTVIGHNVGIAIARAVNGLVVNNNLYGQTQTAIWEYIPGADPGITISNNLISKTIPPTGSPSPATPTNVVAQSTSPSHVNVSWTENSQGVSNFLVMRSTDNQNFSQVASVSGSVTSWTDNSTAGGTTYYYEISAVNAGGASAYSAVSSATTPVQPTAPAAPSGLTGTVSGGTVNLAWTDNSVNETGLMVLRSFDGVTFTTIGTLPPDSMIYSDPTIPAETTAYYEVRAFNTIGASGNSNVFQTFVPSTVPPVTTPGQIAIDSKGRVTGLPATDVTVVGGNTAGTKAVIDTSGLTNPLPQSTYQNERYGNFTYTISGLPPGQSYQLRLDFAETYWTSAGKRVFNVAANGQALLTNFDIFKAAGARNKAVSETFNVMADSSGTVTITFASVKNFAKINGIQLLPLA